MSDASPSSSKAGRWRKLIRYGVILVVIVIAGVFIARRQIGDFLARQLDERMTAAGVYVSWESATWVPGPGIRLRGLAVYRDAAKQDRLAMLGNVKAVKGEPGWDRWDTVAVKTEKAGLVLGAGAGETKLERLSMDLLIQPGKAELRDLRANLNGLRLEAAGAFVRPTSGAAGEEVPRAAPAPGKGLFDDVNLDWLKPLKEWVSFQPAAGEPLLRVEFHSRPDGRGMDLAATLDGKSFQWRGQEWDFMQMSVKGVVGGKGAPVEIKPVRIGHGGQTGEIEGAFDPATGVLRIGRLDSALDVVALARALAPPDAAGILATVSTTGGWRINGAGEIPVGHPEDARWNGAVSLDGDVAYARDGGRVVLQNPSFTLQMDGRVLSVDDFKGNLWEGSLALPATRIHLASAEAKPRFETQISLSGARLQSVMSSFGAAETQPGVCEVDWKGGGGFELSSISGSGALEIREAEFYRIPLLGPLHLVFDQLAPGFGKDVASSLAANHRLEGGVLRVEDLRLDSKFTRVEAAGTVDLARQFAHLNAKTKLQGIAGLATALLSALLEVEGQGPVSDVRWKLKNVPGIGAIGDAAKVVGKTGGEIMDGAGKVVKDGTGAAVDAAKETGKKAKDLLKLPGKLLPGR